MTTVTRTGDFFRLIPSLVALVLVNLIPLFGALFWGWSISDVMLLFWAENVVIGVLNVIRMLVMIVKKQEYAAIFFIFFFIFHYGIFCLVHGAFVVSFFGHGSSPHPVMIENPEYIMLSVLHPEGLLLPVTAIFASHLFSLFHNFIGGREYEKTDSMKLMHAPYGRVVVLHITIVLGGVLVLGTGLGMAYALALLIVLKIGLDVVAHIVEHRKFLKRPEAEA